MSIAYCGHAGSAGSPEGRAQNRAKNNFCATGPPTTLRLDDFRNLHREADSKGIPYKNHNGSGLPPDRSALKGIMSVGGANIGEGSRVRFVGYIDSTYYGAIRTGESVNCKIRNQEDWADIHIELGESRDPQDCNRITAEVSPHYRPLPWTVDALSEVKRAGFPVRITGHLFFDASHSACGFGEDWRASTWEIYPIYRIEVCNTRNRQTCANSQKSRWTDLHEWEEHN